MELSGLCLALLAAAKKGWGQFIHVCCRFPIRIIPLDQWGFAERLLQRDLWVAPAFSSSVSAFRYAARFRRTMTNTSRCLALKY